MMNAWKHAGLWSAALVLLGSLGCGLGEDDSKTEEPEPTKPVAEDICTLRDTAPNQDGLADIEDAGLLSVVHRPEGASAVSGFATFGVTLPSGLSAQSKPDLNGQALAKRLQRIQDPRQRRWAAQHAWDTQRWERQARWQAKIARGERVAPKSNVAVQLQNAGCGGDTCGEAEVCWQGACSDAPKIAIGDSNEMRTMRVASVETLANGSKAAVLVDVALDAALVDAPILRAVANFGSTLAVEQALLGVGDGADQVAPSVLDRDGNGSLALVFTDDFGSNVGDDVVGFFDFRDLLESSDPSATGNQADVLWMRPPNGETALDDGVELVSATLVHEYVHLASYAVRVLASEGALPQESLWLDEALAHLIEDLSGFGRSNVPLVAAALEEWADGPFAGSEVGCDGPCDGVAERGRGYLLLRHLLDMAAKAEGAVHAADSIAAEAAVEWVSSLIAGPYTGFLHPALQELGADGMARWLRGVFGTGFARAQSSRWSDAAYLPQAPSPLTGRCMGMAPRGTMQDETGATVALVGPALAELDGDDDALEGELVLGGSALFLLTGTDANAVLVEADDDLLVLDAAFEALDESQSSP